MDSDSPSSDIEGISLCHIHLNLLKNLESSVKMIFSNISESGFSIWIVGGAVRDSLVNITVNDIDLATDATPSQLMEIFPSSIPTGVNFGTITIPSVGKFGDIQITTLRTDGSYLDGRRPESVRFGTSLLEDLNRRDFKINAMAIDPINLQFYDPHNGRGDLDSGILSAVGDPFERLDEDGLRILRAYRFMCHDSGPFKPDENLGKALVDSVGNLGSISRERIWMEFSKILTYSNVYHVLQKMVEDGVMDFVIPGCTDILSVDDCYIEGISRYDLMIARLSLLLKSVEEENVEEILNQLLVPNKVRNSVISIRGRIGIKPDPESKCCLRRYRMELGDDLLSQLSAERGFSAQISDELRNALSDLPPLVGGLEPLISGNEIISRLGIEPSPLLGQLKQWLFRIQVENDLPDSNSIWQKVESLGFNGQPLGEYRMWV